MKAPQPRLWLVVSLVALVGPLVFGCGTTHWSDTKRTATEQMLLSDAIDRAVSKIDLRPLAGQKVFLDRAPLKDTVDENYTVSVLRQHMMASGCILKEKAEEADYVVEARAGVVGTSRHDVLYGMPSTDLPQGGPVPGVPNRIPEIPIAKKTDQQGVAKVALFAYHRQSGIPLWQSGNSRVASTVKDTWVLGIGPFEQGTIHASTKFAGDEIRLNQLNRLSRSGKLPPEKIWVAQGIQFNTAETVAARTQQDRETRLAQQPPKPSDAPAAKDAPAAPLSTAVEVAPTVGLGADRSAYPKATIQSIQPEPMPK
ncbi:MAG: hypothetical protein K8T91_21125 [Planctomycetes bacterium]|nr:hypothetical protein [Planctomycetota bacterium]